MENASKIPQSQQDGVDQFSYPHQSLQNRDTFGDTIKNEPTGVPDDNDYIRNIQTYLDETQKRSKHTNSNVSPQHSNYAEESVDKGSFAVEKPKEKRRRAIFEQGHIPLSNMQSHHNVNHIQGNFGDKSKFSFEGNIFDQVNGIRADEVNASSPRFNKVRQKQNPVRAMGMGNRGIISQEGGNEQISSGERDGDTYDCNSYFKNLIRHKFQQKKPQGRKEIKSKIMSRFNLNGISDPLDIIDSDAGKNTQSYRSLIKNHQEEKKRREVRAKRENEYPQNPRSKKKRVKSRGFKPFKNRKKSTKIVNVDLDHLSRVSQKRKKSSRSKRRGQEQLKKQKSSRQPYSREIMKLNTHRPSSNRRAKKREVYNTNTYTAAFETPMSKRNKGHARKKKSPLKVIHQEGSYLDQFIRPGFPDSSSKKQRFVSTNREFSPLSSPISSPYRKKAVRRGANRAYGMQKKQSRKVLIDVDMLSKKTMSKMKRSLI